ncbi:MAG: hypothetical protein AAGI91_15435 [Bacteroidota bacterium]
MADWYEVFDNEQVQFDTRKWVGRLAGALVVGFGAVIGLTPLLLLWLPSVLLVIGLVSALLTAMVVGASYAFLRLRSVVWCVKLSVHRVVGYDYARRRTVLSWDEIERVELDANSLSIVASPTEKRPGRVLRVPHVFADFARLSHRTVEYAESHSLPVCVEGRPWQLLDLEALYPFLADTPITQPATLRRGRTLEGDEEA